MRYFLDLAYAISSWDEVCRGKIPSSHYGAGGGFYLSNIHFGVVLKCQTKKTSIIQGNEPEVDVSQLPGGQATDERHPFYFFSSKAITVLLLVSGALVTSYTPV